MSTIHLQKKTYTALYELALSAGERDIADSIAQKDQMLDKEPPQTLFAKKELEDALNPLKISGVLETPPLKNYFQMDRSQALEEIHLLLQTMAPKQIYKFQKIKTALALEVKDHPDLDLFAFMQLKLEERQNCFNRTRPLLPAPFRSSIPLLMHTHLANDVAQIDKYVASLPTSERGYFYWLIYSLSRDPAKGGEGWGEYHAKDDLEVYRLAYWQIKLVQGATHYNEIRSVLTEAFNPSLAHKILCRSLPPLNNDLLARALFLGKLYSYKKLLLEKHPVDALYPLCKKIETALFVATDPFAEADHVIKTLKELYQGSYSRAEAESAVRLLMNGTGKVQAHILSSHFKRAAMADITGYNLESYENYNNFKPIYLVKDETGNVFYKYKAIDEKKGLVREMASSCIEELFDPLNALPMTIPQKVPNDLPRKGIFQVWGERTDTAWNLRKIDRPKFLACPKHLVHHHALLALIKGKMDGHMKNSLFQFGHDGQISHILDCDDEHSLPEKNHSFERIRMWVFGHPRSAEPFDAATLRIFSHEKLYQRTLQFAKRRYSLLGGEALRALEDRLIVIQAIMKDALEKKAQLTPRDLFFTLFGCKEVFEQKSAEGVDPVDIFNYFLTPGIFIGPDSL